MQYTDPPPTCINSSAKMHEAAGVVCNNHRCASAHRILQFIVHHAFRHITVLNRSRASEFVLVEPRISLLVTWHMDTGQVRLLGPGRDIGSTCLVLLS